MFTQFHISEYTSDPALFFYTPKFFFSWILSKLEVQKMFLVIQIFTEEFSYSNQKMVTILFAVMHVN